METHLLKPVSFGTYSKISKLSVSIALNPDKKNIKVCPLFFNHSFLLVSSGVLCSGILSPVLQAS